MRVVGRLLIAMLVSAAAPMSAEDVSDVEGSVDDTITVVATRTERSLDEVAATVSVKTAEDIERELARDIADLVRFEPGVTVSGTGDRFGLDGFNIRGIGGNRVLTLIDGVRVAEAFSFGPFLSARRDFVDVDSLSRLEIARGPISSLYGSDALGGVVALTTKQPRELVGEDRPFAATFKGGYSGADDSVAGTFGLAGGSETISGMLLYTRRSGDETTNMGATDGTGAGRERPDPQTFGLDNFTAKLVASPSETHAFTLGLDHYTNDTETRILSDYGSRVFGTTVDRRDADDARRRHRWSMDYRYAGGLGVADTAQVTLYRQSSETEQVTFEDRTTPARAKQRRERKSSYDQEIDGVMVQLGKAIDAGGARHLFTYGIDYTVTDSASIRDGGTFDASGAPLFEFLPLPTRDFPLSEVVQFAMFVQDEVELLDGRLVFTPSIRFDRFDADARADSIYLSGNPGSLPPQDYEDSALTTKLGAWYGWSDRYSVYARYSEGFRAPPYSAVNVGFTSFQGGYKTIANPNLRSERSEGLEIGMRLRSEIGSAQFAVFRNDYEDFIESLSVAAELLMSGAAAQLPTSLGIDPADGLLTFQAVNREDVMIQGWEARGNLVTEAGLTARAAIAYAKGEDRQNDQPVNEIEPLTAVLGLGYEAADNRWGAELVATLARGKDESDIDPISGRLATGGYGIIDLLAHADLGERVRLNVGLFNITDRTYIRWADTVAIGSDAARRFTQPGFHAGMSLRMAF